MRTLAFALLAVVAAAGPLAAQDRTLNLPIGDPARKDRLAPVAIDAITDTATGALITPADLAERLAGVRLLLAGESHTAMECHRVQARVIELLQKSGRQVVIGLEMFPYTEQRWLDAWRTRMLTERGFVYLSRWYEHWGYNWEYYRDIFQFAQDHNIPLLAVNAPRDVVTAVRKKGFASLTPEEAAHIPSSVDVDSAEHLTLFKASFDEGDPLHRGMTEAAWNGMLSAQATWDATMGFQAVRALERPEYKEAIVVVLVGSGHVSYGLGIERQAKRWFGGRIATLIPVAVKDGKAPAVRASYANFLWGVPAEADPLFPSLEISTRAAADGHRREVNYVEPDSMAERAGFKVGDLIVSIDGQAAPNQEFLKRLLASKRWGDVATVIVEREGRQVTLTAALRRGR
jgi:uncharacterized iron-regulated protein